MFFKHVFHHQGYGKHHVVLPPAPGEPGINQAGGTADWPRARFLFVAISTWISGVGVTACSEHPDTAWGAWADSDLMPILPGTGIGLSPPAQRFVIQSWPAPRRDQLSRSGP